MSEPSTGRFLLSALLTIFGHSRPLRAEAHPHGSCAQAPETAPGRRAANRLLGETGKSLGTTADRRRPQASPSARPLPKLATSDAGGRRERIESPKTDDAVARRDPDTRSISGRAEMRPHHKSRTRGHTRCVV